MRFGIIINEVEKTYLMLVIPSLLLSHSALKIYLPIRQFFYDIIHPEFSPVCDVYALMFLIDVVNLMENDMRSSLPSH